MTTSNTVNNISNERRCVQCEQNKPLDMFYYYKARIAARRRYNTPYHTIRCKDCIKFNQRQRGLNLPIRCKQAIHDARKAAIKCRHSPIISSVSVLIASYTGKCFSCGIAEEVKTIHDRGRRINGLVADHCHTTGIFRGWLCNSCNTAIGHANDNISRLEEMIVYLKKYKVSEECKRQDSKLSRRLRGLS